MKKTLIAFGFIFLGVFSYGAKSAKAFNNFVPADGYLSGSPAYSNPPSYTTVLNFTLLNQSPTTIYSTTTNTNDYRPAFYANASSTLGTFYAINTITLGIINNQSPVNDNIRIFCTDGAGAHTGLSDGTPVPLSSPLTAIQYISFNFSSPVICDSLNLFSLVIEADGGYGYNYPVSIVHNVPGTGITTVAGNFSSAYYNLLIGINEIYVSTQNNTGVNTLQQTTCPSTGFVLLSVDFGQGFCNLARFLFVPSQDSLNQWNGSKTLLASTTPFSYLYTLGALIGNINTTTASMTPLTLTVGTGTPMSMSVDIFSANTIDRYTDTNSRGVVRTLIEYALFLMFVAMVIFEVRHLFKPKK